MNCPECGCPMSQTRVIDSRRSGSTVYRRRMCRSCGGRFTTFEITEDEYNALLKEAHSAWAEIKEADRLITELQNWRAKHGR